MSLLTKEKILDTLSGVLISGSGEDIVSAGMISSVLIRNDEVGFVIEIPAGSSFAEGEELRKISEKKVAGIEGVKKVTAVLTSEFSGTSSGKSQANLGSVKVEAKSAPKGGVKTPTPKSIPGIKHIIAVGSGKGGVGKSTIAVNLAASLAKLGFATGIVDADIYGPSIAMMMGASSEPEVKNNKMIPPMRHGVKCLSMGMLLGEGVPVIWRGPMISKALQQLMFGADWGNLDYLVIDLPPGTGDIHLGIAQNFKLDGVVIVATPQNVALLDVKKAIAMFNKVGTPIFGVVENMAYFIDPVSGNKNYIFGNSGVKKMCEDMGIKYLGDVPVNPLISETSDAGNPITASNPNETAAKTISDIAKNIAASIA